MTGQDLTRELDARIDALELGRDSLEGLFSASDLVAGQSRLRSTLGDQSVPAEVRQDVARQLFGDRIGADAAEAVAVIAGAADGPRQLESLLERAAVRQMQLRSGDLDAVQDELFRVARTIEADSGLRATLGDSGLELPARQQLLAGLLGGKVHPVTLLLSERALRRGGRALVKTLDGYVGIAAEIRSHRVAKVTVAQPLSQAQSARLETELTRIYGVGIDVQVSVDPTVLGGVRVEVGDELIDGTITNRVSEARRLIG